MPPQSEDKAAANQTMKVVVIGMYLPAQPSRIGTTTYGPLDFRGNCCEVESPVDVVQRLRTRFNDTYIEQQKVIVGARIKFISESPILPNSEPSSKRFVTK